MAMGRSLSAVVHYSCCLKNQYIFCRTAMTSLLVPPMSVRGMTYLDRDAFTTVVNIPVLKLTKLYSKMDQHSASLIVVENEILIGQTVDINTSYLSKSLRTAGLNLQRITMVPDVVDDIAKKIKSASQKYSVVFTSGGVDPTHDVVTYEAVAKAFKLKLESHQELVDMYTRMNSDQQEIKRLAIVPNPCKIINVNFTEVFPVIKVKNVYLLPGSSKYFEAAVNTIIPQLKECTSLHFEHIDVKLNELSVVNILDKQAKRWDNKVKIGSYLQSEPQTFTRITLEGSKEAVIEAKEELLYYLPVQKLINMEPRLSRFQMNALLEDDETYVKCALNVVKECYDRYKSDEIFISFNGGKDCTAVLHLAAIVAKSRNISSLLCLYVTADSFPEVEAFVELASQFYGLTVIRKPRPLRSAISTFLEEKRNLKASLMGMRRDDPSSANLQPFALTDPDWPQLMRVNPILNWSYSQVWIFLLKHNVPYCPLYDQGYTSLGNKSSTMKNPLLKDPNDPSSYLPAYTLTDKFAERRGRL